MFSRSLRVSWKKFSIYLSLETFVVLAVIFFSHNGIRDLLSLKSQMNRTSDHIQTLEESNRELRRRMDIMAEMPTRILEDEAREKLGLIRQNEIIYFEK
ncbi:MAG: hypothetical protein COV44_02290 [Deltaproteobacteria bacterium CG11_big_fil_rev_8_21_14_0_20_45_16]|nr:MAG: hypothetical protein COV44_02290 [Deltaproteobacteria bacterium CG11_big_fil_rev_8_21_14_0_20_45_16]